MNDQDQLRQIFMGGGHTNTAFKSNTEFPLKLKGMHKINVGQISEPINTNKRARQGYRL
jgi:hypothetical protein